MADYLLEMSKCCTACKSSPCDACGGTCCLYPASGAGTFFTAADLPSSLNYIDLSDGSTTTLTLTGDYNYTAGGYALTLLSGLWTLSGTTNDDAQGCLVSTYGNFGVITDNFADTYTVNGTDTITRSTSDICQWSGPKAGGGIWMLDYGLTTPGKWHLASAGSTSNTADDKTSPQSSPVGTYGSQSIA